MNPQYIVDYFYDELQPLFWWGGLNGIIYAGELGDETNPTLNHIPMQVWGAVGGVWTSMTPEVWGVYDDPAEVTPVNNFDMDIEYEWAGTPGDALYIGFESNKITRISVQNTRITNTSPPVVLAHEYWDGSAWVSLPGAVDTSNGFDTPPYDTTLTFTTPSDWERCELNTATVGHPSASNPNTRAYYVRYRMVSGAYTVGAGSDWPAFKWVSGFSSTNDGWTLPCWNQYGDLPCSSILIESKDTTRRVFPNYQPLLGNDLWSLDLPESAGGGIVFLPDALANGDVTIQMTPYDYRNDDAITFGYCYAITAPDGEHNDTEVINGSYPDQLGFSVRFQSGYDGTDTGTEIIFSVRDEQDRVNERGAYLEVTLYDNQEAAPDFQGLPAGEVFTHTVPGDPFTVSREAYRKPGDNWDVNGDGPQFWKFDRSIRANFVGFSLYRTYSSDINGDPVTTWRCAFYHNGRFNDVEASPPGVPHDTLHQTLNEANRLFNMYDDGSIAPAFFRSSPGWVTFPFYDNIFYPQAKWDEICDVFFGQSHGVDGYYDFAAAEGPPKVGLEHTSEIFGNQLRTLHHTHTTGGNARFVPPVITKRFRLTLTGTPDATTDVQLPLRSFNVIKNVGEEQTCSFVIPYREEILAAINDRPNGIYRLEFSLIDSNGLEAGSNPNWDTYLEAAQNDVQLFQGARQATAVLQGLYTFVDVTEQSHTIQSQKIVRESVEGGVHELVVEFDPLILPGHTASYTTAIGTESFLIRQVIVGATNQGDCVMTLEEDSGSG